MVASVSRLVSRGALLRSLAALAAGVQFAPRAAAAYDLDTALALASLVQWRAAVGEVDAVLFAPLLLPRPAAVTSESGSDARARLKLIIERSRVRELGREAVAAGRRAQLLERYPTDGAKAVDGHVREAEEALYAILERDRADGLKKDALNRELRSMRPDELAFYHKALVAAREEMRLALRCFGADEREAAAALARRAAGGDDSAEPDERAIGQAIAALEAAGPSAAFTRTGVQAGLDEEVLLRNRRRAAEPVVDD